MRDKHPIDDLFRGALLNVSAEPPGSVHDAVMAALRRKKRRAAWYRSRAIIAAAILLLGSGALWYALYNPVADVSGSSSATTQAPENPSATPPSPSPVLVENEQRSAQATSAANNAEPGQHKEADHDNKGSLMTGTPDSRNASDPAKGSSTKTSTPDQPRKPVAQVPITQPSTPTPVYSPAIAVSGVGLLDNAIAEHLPSRLVRPSPATPTAQPQWASSPADFAVRSGAWWGAVGIGTYNARHQWDGSYAHLTEALNSSEAWTSTIGLGFMAGRDWSSGFGVGTGLEWERSEQAFSHTERTTDYEATAVMNYVTLNTTVFAVAGDTMITPVTHEQHYEALDRRTVWRVPLEAYWHWSVRRWSWGPRIGGAVEFTQVRSTSSLTSDGTTDAVYAATLDKAVLQDRYPPVLLAVLGADVGFLLTEHLSIGATPLYMHRLGGGAEHSSVTASPERAGVRFQLTYSL